MPPRTLLLAALLAVPAAARAQTSATPVGKAVSVSGETMCGIKMSVEEFKPISNLARCLTHCPIPNGYEGCRTGVMGFTDLTPGETGGVWHEALACDAYRGSAGKLARAAAETDGGKWGAGRCPGEFGAAAEVLFGRAKTDKSLYPAALAVMRKAGVRGPRFAPLLYQALGADGPTQPILRSLALDLLRRNFINAPDAADRVDPPYEVLVPLMYDANPTVAALAVGSVADRIHNSVRGADARVEEALKLLGPVIGTNDSFNPLPAGVSPAVPAARKAALDAIGGQMILVGAGKPARHKLLRHLMRLRCEQDAVHKAAFDLYYTLLTPDADYLRTEKKQKGEDGSPMSREDLWADQLYQALFGAGDMAGSKNENPNGAHYSRNCIGPITAN